MPQLVKGAKWVFGWVVVGPGRELVIPPVAWNEYGFQVGDAVTFIRGSRRSGGFGLTHARLLVGMPALLQMRALARSSVDGAGWVVAPAVLGIRPDDRLLAVRGSGRALGFVSRGPIYEEALKHPELVCFGTDAVPTRRISGEQQHQCYS